MDAWSEKQLKFMSIGGNETLKKFFTEFDLLEEPVQARYKTKAAKFYRHKVSQSR